MTRSAPDWEALQGAISGEVVLPGSSEYEAARKPAIARFHDARPRAVVFCETPDDVSEAISFALMPRPSPTATSASCFCTWSSSIPMHRPPKGRPRGTG